MKRKFYYLIPIIILPILITIFYYTNKTNSEFEKEKEKYLKDVKKINYETTLKWNNLKPLSENKNIKYLSWSLVKDWKTLTWEYLNIFDTKIFNEKNNFYIFKKANKAEVIWSWSTEKWEKINIVFEPWFSKMKLLWKYYGFEKENINNSDNYNLELFITNKWWYVMEFENLTEKLERDKIFNDYKEKVKEIKNKYWDKQGIANKLIKELNDWYNIDINKLQ